MSRGATLSAAAALSLVGAAVLAAVIFRDVLLELAVAAAATRLSWGFAKAQLGIPRPARPEGSARVPAWIAALSAAWAAWRVPRELRRRP